MLKKNVLYPPPSFPLNYKFRKGARKTYMFLERKERKKEGRKKGRKEEGKKGRRERKEEGGEERRGERKKQGKRECWKKNVLYPFPLNYNVLIEIFWIEVWASHHKGSSFGRPKSYF